MRDREYAIKRVKKLMIELELLKEAKKDWKNDTKSIRRSISNTKAYIRRWVNAYPDMKIGD